MSDIDDKTRDAWGRLEAACAGLLARQCKRHAPYMGCATDCNDVANALDPEFAEAQPLITAALAEIRTLRAQSADLAEQVEGLRRERDKARRERDVFSSDNLSRERDAAIARAEKAEAERDRLVADAKNLLHFNSDRERGFAARIERDTADAIAAWLDAKSYCVDKRGEPWRHGDYINVAEWIRAGAWKGETP